jgi:hypothetical protein
VAGVTGRVDDDFSPWRLLAVGQMETIVTLVATAVSTPAINLLQAASPPLPGT